MKSQETIALEKKDLEISISNAMADAYLKAFDSLGRYKFLMFGYWAGQWVKLNSLLPHPQPNPFAGLVIFARERPDLKKLDIPEIISDAPQYQDVPEVMK